MRILGPALLIALSGVCREARAVVLHGSFTGTVLASRDLGGRAFGGPEEDGQVGLPITGTFRVPPALALLTLALPLLSVWRRRARLAPC